MFRKFLVGKKKKVLVVKNVNYIYFVSKILEGRKELMKWFFYVWVVIYRCYLYYFLIWFIWNILLFVLFFKKKIEVFICYYYFLLENIFLSVIINLSLNIFLNIVNLYIIY